MITTWTQMVENNYPLSNITENSREYEIMKKAAENGDKFAQHSMGMWYQEVMGDSDEAKKWYKRAEGQGLEGAQKAYSDLCKGNSKPGETSSD